MHVERAPLGQTRSHSSLGLNHSILPSPTNEQRRIVEKIEAMFDEIDKGVESLQTARTTLGLYRQSLLKSAFEGRLTADWRAQNADKLEAPETLLARIQAERDARYKAALDAWQDALAQWRADGEKGKKPAKPKRYADLDWLTRELGLNFQRPKDGHPETDHASPWLECREQKSRSRRQGPIPTVANVQREEISTSTENKRSPGETFTIEKWLELRSGDFLITRGNGTIDTRGVAGFGKSSPNLTSRKPCICESLST